MKIKITKESIAGLHSYHGIDAEKELTELLLREVDKIILEKLISETKEKEKIKIKFSPKNFEKFYDEQE
ncbi:MAG: hypothetical protein ABIP51_15175 [Bacteroidia bacterium]